ncbi:dolichyl-diphosphooligosaccharide--protein glycosyltransferase subunit 2, partial [Amborella trichopoda]|uniref:dolichyl-diphosphooligosaccharide--protein glycosyltransferase subunit 2 n=1 Tax=Amborella trichopoda TaxID=13333 RepID=UPI0005D3B036
PISNGHRSAALELFVPSEDGSYGSLEETYEALRTFQILGVKPKNDVHQKACSLVLGALKSSSTITKELFYALKVNGLVNCQLDGGLLKGVASSLQKAVKDANALFDYYYSVGGLVLIKEQGSESNTILADGSNVFHSIKALSQSDGTWRFRSDGTESSTYAAGIAFETLAGIVALSDSEIDQSMIGIVKNDITKLFDSLESYDDGASYFDEKRLDASKYHGPLSTTSSVVRGIAEFGAVIPGRLNIPGDKILGLANFLLSIGVPRSTKDLYDQLDALSRLENNRISIPLVLSLPSTVLSLTSKDKLEVKVSTVLGSDAPPLTLNLMQAVNSISKDAPAIQGQELKFDMGSSVYMLDFLSMGIDVGTYDLVFEVLLHDSEQSKVYTTGGRTKASIVVTGIIKIDNAELAVLDSDVGSVETLKKLDLSKESTVSLSANHLQKLRLSFHLATPHDNPFKPHQVFLKLKHETGVEHAFTIVNSGKKFEIIMDFLGLVEKLYYLSGKYDIELTVGDSVMENSFLSALGHVELDLPDPPEKAPHAPALPVDPYSRFGAKTEISHIFRAPEKRPPKELSLAFLALTLLPFVGFLVGLLRLGVNLKNFPSSALPAGFAILFQGGIGAVLILYVLFWIKLDLFTTLKVLGLLGVFLVFVGHRTLSHLASASAKVKSA